MRRFRWLMAMCLAMLLVCGLVGGVPSAQAAPFAGGSGTEGEPYLIETAGQLNEVRNYLDNHFKLNASINLAVYGSDYDSGRGWEPIGTSGNPFTGSVHGAVYTVSDLYIDREDDYTGLFGYLNGAVIESIVLKDIHVTGSKYVGGLAGYAQDSDVSDSHSEGVIEAFKFAGGLAGVVNGTDICNSSAGVNIAGYNSIGGLLGQVAGGTCNIINSYAAGDVVADSMYIGGLIGIVESADTEIVNSYAMGNVWSGGNGHLGGLVGSFGGAKITNSYAAGKVESQDTPVGGLVGNNYSGEITGSFYDTDTSGQSDTGKGEPKSTLEMIQEATFTGWDFNTVWLIEEGLSYPYLKDNRQDPKPVPPELFAGGNGEAATPFLIETPEHLDNVRIYLGSEHANKHFKLMGNIDLGVSPWNTGEGWEPIGINESSFTGSFDGNGYTISNLFINRANTNYVGLFGYAEGAEFSDMKLEGVNVTGGSGVGGLVGFVYEGSIAGSLTTGGVKGNYQVGGLVGRASDCTIEDSLADSTVICGNYNGHSRVGGLVGEASNMMITNCHAMGEVTGQGLEVGGLVGRGDGSTITSCYATVTVMSSGNRVGGLLGYEGSSFEVLDCHANGSVTGNDYVGGLVGINYGRISSSFATGDVTGRNYVGGLAGYNNWGGNNEIVNSYATGPVTGNDKVGGLAG